MSIRDLLELIQNGSVHIWIFDTTTGELVYKSIWHNYIDKDMWTREIKKIEVERYTLRLYI